MRELTLFEKCVLLAALETAGEDRIAKRLQDYGCQDTPALDIRLAIPVLRSFARCNVKLAKIDDQGGARPRRHNMKTGEDNPELYQEAVDAWLKWCEETGSVPEMPSKYDTFIGKKYVYLQKINGFLAKYDIQKKVIVP
jgi:hypothetical protein